MSRELLELCGFEPEQIEEELPLVEKAFSKLGLTAEDVARGNSRIRQFFEIELTGVRKTLGAILLEFVTLIASEDKRMIYTTDPVIAGGFIEAAMIASEEVQACNPEVLASLMVGGIFDKLDPLLAAGERLWLKKGNAHCSYCRIELGLVALNLIPKPTLWNCTAYMCPELTKSLELIGDVFDIPLHFMTRCTDRNWHEPMTPQREVSYFAGEVERCVRRLGEALGTEITDEVMEEAERLRASYSTPLVEIERLWHSSDPVPISVTIEPYLCYLKSFPVTPKARKISIEAIELLRTEIEERVRQGKGVTPKGAPRVIQALYIHQSDPSVVHLLEQELGTAIPVNERQLYQPDGRTSPDTSGFEHPFEKLAATICQRSYNGTRFRANALIGACKRFDLDGVFWFNHSECRPRGLDAWLIRDMVRAELDIPFLVLDADLWEPRYYDLKQLRPRIEAFIEMAKDYKAAKVRV